MWVIPLLLFFGVRRWCRELRASDLIEEGREQAEQEAEEHERRLAQSAQAQTAP
jgi:hypothetical protein